MSIFKKDKDRKYFISYPTWAMRYVKAISGLYFMLICNFIEEGKMQEEGDSHPSIFFLNQTHTYKPAGSQWQSINVPVLLTLLNLQNSTEWFMSL